jgi:hypothetical protein
MAIKRNVVTDAILVSLTTISLPLLAGITLTGDIKSTLPTANITKSDGDAVAFVKTFSAFIDGESGPCEFTFNESEALNNQKPMCYLEWLDSYGLAGTKNKLNGIPTRVGDLNLGYTVSIFSGSAKDKILLTTGAVTIPVLNPVAPVIVNSFSDVSRNFHEGEDVGIFNKKHKLNAVKVELEERNYDQKIILDNYGECLILEGQTDCSVLTDSRFFGSEIENFGNYRINYNMNSANDYFALGFPKIINYDWDYRPPGLDGVEAYVVKELVAPNKTVVIAGLTVDLENERAKAVISSSHHARTDDWWLPKVVELQLRPQDDMLPNGQLTVDGNILFEAADDRYIQEVILESVGEPVREGNQWVYQFDLHTVPDGMYDMVLTAADDNKNSSTKEFGDIAILRTLPQIKLFKNYKELNDSEGFYFTENILAASFNDYLHSSQVDSITLNGIRLELDHTQKDAKKVITDVETLGLEYGEQYDFIVTVSDTAGNIITKSYTGTYRPIQFDLEVDSGSTTYQAVQNVTAVLKQVKNEICELYPSLSFAVNSASRSHYGCVFRWTSIPNGLTQNNRSRIPVLNGFVNDLGVQDLSYNIFLYDHNGHEALIASNTKTLEAIEPTNPVIEVPEGFQGTDKYTVPMSGGALITSKVTTVPAAVYVTTGIEGSGSERSYSKMQSLRYETQTSSAKVYVDSGELWEVRDVPIYAEYDNLKTVNSTKFAKALFIPDRGLSMKLLFEDEYALDNRTEKVKVSFGRYDRKTKSFDFDPSRMGEWDVQLVKMINRSDYSPISDVKRFSASSTIEFDLDSAVLSELNTRIMAVAKVVAPGAIYEQTLNSNKIFMRILNGGDVSGSLNYKKDKSASENQIIGHVPFSTSITYRADSKTDSLSIDRSKVYWEKSIDGSTWTALTQDIKNRKTKVIETLPVTSLIYRDKIAVAGNTYVRIALTNKYTGTVSYSDKVNIIAYDKVSVAIEATNTPFYGEQAEYKLFVKTPDPVNPRGFTLEVVDPAEMEIQWSYDRIDWFYGTPEIAVNESDLIDADGKLTSSRYLMARTRLLGDAVSIGEDGWSTPAKVSYKWRKPSKVKIKTFMPSRVEVGTTFIGSVKVVSRNADMTSRVRYEWVLDGNVIASDVSELDLVADPLYIDKNYYRITHRAWIDGQKEDTFRETNLKVRTWEYEFPNTSLKALNSSAYAPNVFRAQSNVRLPRLDGVEYISEFFIADDGGDSAASFTTDRNNFATFSFKDPGIKRIGYRLKDNRGNISEITEIVELFPPFPMVIGLTETHSNEQMRYPLDMTLRSTAEVAHPDDRVVDWKWYVTNLSDLSVKEYDTSGRLYLKNLGVKGGEVDYNIRLVSTTRFGQEGESEFNVHINKNIPPTCIMDLKESSTQLKWELKCSDVDGKIVKYNWYVDGIKLSNYQHTITMTKSRIVGESVTVKGEGVDDSEDVDSITELYFIK